MHSLFMWNLTNVVLLADQIIEMLAEEFSRFVLDCNLKQSSIIDSGSYSI